MIVADKFDPISRNIAVSFSPAPPKRFCNKAASFAQEILSRISLQSFRNAWSVATQNDFGKVFLRAWKPGSYVTELPTPTGTVYLTADPSVMRKIFDNYRKSPTGLFYDQENTKLLVKGILSELCPEEVKKLGLEKAAEMFVFTTSAAHSSNLRAPYLKFIGPNAISAQRNTLNEIADGIFTHLTEDEKLECDGAKLSCEFAVTVISKLFTNYGTCREDYQKIANAQNIFFKSMERKVLSKPLSAQETEEYKIAQKTVLEMMEQCLASPSSFVQGLMAEGLNDFQLKSFLFGLYFAGTETTASVMNYLIWQLGREENFPFQEEIRDPVNGEKAAARTIAEAFRLHPSVFIMGRNFRENTLVTVKNKEQHILWEKELLQGHNIVCLPRAAGLDPDLYPEPEKFNPHRFAEPRIPNLSFFPFGGGPHICPGRYLALAELQAFLDRLLHHFSIRTLSPENTDQKGVFTLRATPAKIQLISRRKINDERD